MARRGSVCELTSPEGHTVPLDDPVACQPPPTRHRRLRDLSHLGQTIVAGGQLSPTDLSGPPAASRCNNADENGPYRSGRAKYREQPTRFPFPPPLARKSTSDLTSDVGDCKTLSTELGGSSQPSSPRGLSYLASRRPSNQSGGSSVISDLPPLPNMGRRTSNFLELPSASTSMVISARSLLSTLPASGQCSLATDNPAHHRNTADYVRPRVCSLPEKSYNPRLSDDLYRLRTFSITNKGVINYGDSIIDRKSRSNTSINSTNSRVSPLSPWQGSCCSQTTNISTETMDIAKYRVVLLGDSGVGKTALVSQFMTSEYMNTYDASLDDEFGEKTVSVLLDGEESELVFIDHPSSEMSVENCMSTYEPHGAVVVYSVVNKASFKVAEDILSYLWRESYTQDKSVILVGNKVDLARARTISSNEGKSLAASRDCKFIETSSGIQHNVDELLVGILKQIRLREVRELKKNKRRLHSSKTSLSLNAAKEILARMCLSDGKSKSCENLHVL